MNSIQSTFISIAQIEIFIITAVYLFWCYKLKFVPSSKRPRSSAVLRNPEQWLKAWLRQALNYGLLNRWWHHHHLSETTHYCPPVCSLHCRHNTHTHKGTQSLSGWPESSPTLRQTVCKIQTIRWDLITWNDKETGLPEMYRSSPELSSVRLSEIISRHVYVESSKIIKTKHSWNSCYTLEK